MGALGIAMDEAQRAEVLRQLDTDGSGSISFEEYLGTDVYTATRSFLLGQDCEKVPHAEFTSEDFGGGWALLLDFKGVGTAADKPARCHVLLTHETAMSITESGVLVSM